MTTHRRTVPKSRRRARTSPVVSPTDGQQLQEGQIEREAQRLARSLLKPGAEAEMRRRMIAGTLAPLTEVALFRLAYGPPREAD